MSAERILGGYPGNTSTGSRQPKLCGRNPPPYPKAGLAKRLGISPYGHAKNYVRVSI